MIYRIYPTKDTFITNAFVPPNRTQMTASNLGGSEELDVFKLSGISGAIGTLGSSSLGRILMQFDLSAFTALTSSGDIPTSGLTYTLRMNHKTHGCGGTPSSFDLVVKPVASVWDEGLGQDVERLRDSGFANWVKRTSTSFWTTPGGDFLTASNLTVHFDTGLEDLQVDVTSMVNGWLSGTITNNGLAIMMTSSIETDSLYVDYYQKKFYSRQTDYTDRVPYIEVRANDSIRDDRVNMQWNRTGSLFIYNLVGGLFQSLPGNLVTTTISDASGVLLQLTASQVSVGVYSASFALPTGSYSGSLFHDSWGSGSFAFATGSFSLASVGPSSGISQVPITARIRNLRDEYLPEDVEVLEVFFRKKPKTLSVVQTASLGTSPYIVEQAYYAIENDATRERVIPFGTGSQQHTRLSYGQNGNSFTVRMTNLHAGNVYRIIFLVNESGRHQIIDNGFRFRIV